MSRRESVCPREGARIAQVAASGGTTTTTVYVGSVAEVSTTGGTTTTIAYYGGVAEAVNGTFSYLASSGLGSVTVALNASGAAIASTLYAPYGTTRYSNGVMPGSFGFSGQRADAVTGLDFYGARYYDPSAGQFASADTIGLSVDTLTDALNRYAYVGDNPTTRTDPSGHGFFDAIAQVASAVVHVAAAVVDTALGVSSMVSDVQTIFSGNSSGLQKLLAIGDLALNVAMDVSTVVGVGEGARAAYLGAKLAAHAAEDVGEHVAEHVAEDTATHEGEGAAAHAGECGLSFAAATLVATPSGEKPIAALKVGDSVQAYDPATGKASVQTVQRTFVNHDTDRLDVTLRTTAPKSVNGKPAASAAPSEETVHTTANHPWLSADRGWVVAGELRVGERVVRADGTTAIVEQLADVPGVGAMYDLTVGQLHDFVVGAGQYVVHNCGSGLTRDDPVEVDLPRSEYPETASHIEDATANGQPEVTQWDPTLKDANRRESLRGWGTKSGYDRDEWPMASTREGGRGADVRYVRSSDNRGAGTYIAAQLARLPGRGVGYFFRVRIS